MNRWSWSGLLVCLVACGALRENPLGEPDSPDAATPPPDAAEEPTPDAAPDTGPKPPPIREDVACEGTNAWFVVERAAECSQRRLRVVQSTPVDAINAFSDIHTAWSLSGRLGIVLSWVDGVEAGYLQALTFDTASPEFTVRQDIVRPPTEFQREGEGARIAARPDGTFEVISQRNEQDNGGDVFLRSLPPLQGFTEPTTVFTAADRHSALGLVVHSDSSITATATMPSGADSAIATRRRQPQATEFDAPLPGTLDFFRPGTATNGNHQMAFDSYGGIHLVYEFGLGETRSQPRSVQFVTDHWDNLRTVDNNVPNAMSGASLSLFLLGDEKNAVYFGQLVDAQDEPLPEAQLIRARWRGANEPIQRTTLDTGFGVGVSGPGFIHGTAAAAADASGAMHVVVARQTVNGAPGVDPKCQVFYLHEAAVGGVVQLLRDTVSDELPCSNQAVPVALAVEPGGRPHIAYVDSTQGVVYATRYDR